MTITQILDAIKDAKHDNTRVVISREKFDRLARVLETAIRQRDRFRMQYDFHDETFSHDTELLMSELMEIAMENK